jgi:hypothetical protein
MCTLSGGPMTHVLRMDAGRCSENGCASSRQAESFDDLASVEHCEGTWWQRSDLSAMGGYLLLALRQAGQ